MHDFSDVGACIPGSRARAGVPGSRARKRQSEARQIGLIPTVEAIDAFAAAKVDCIRLWPKWLGEKSAVAGGVGVAATPAQAPDFA